MPRELPPPDVCANCGTTIPRGARACPECGADENTGWRNTSLYDGIDLPDSAFEDETGAEAGASPPPTRRINGVPWYWWCVGVVLLALLVLSFLTII